MNYWFSSDYHLRHINILKYCERPFLNIEEHDETIINNHNSLVKSNDIFYFLGDFCFGNKIHALKLLQRLNGKIKLLEGNHDSAIRNLYKSKDKFQKELKNVEFFGGLKEIKINGQRIILCHYAMRVWATSHRGSFHVFGHSHNSLPDNPHILSMDVGVDCNNYFPFSFEEIKERMSKKLWKPIDHHGKRLEGGGIGLSKEDYEKLDRKRLYEQLKKEFEK